MVGTAFRKVRAVGFPERANKGVAVLSAYLPPLAAVSGINCHCDHLLLIREQTWPRPSSGLGGFEGMVRGLAQPFASRLLGKRCGFCVVPLDRTVRQSSIGAMGFNRRKMEDQRRHAAEKEAASRRATGGQVLEDAERLIAAWNERQAKRMPMLFSASTVPP